MSICCTDKSHIVLSCTVFFCTRQVRDSGGSLTVHTFGAYFGLMVSRILHQPRMDKYKKQQDMGNQPDVFAVVGTKLELYNTRVTDMVVEGPSPTLGQCGCGFDQQSPANHQGQRSCTSLGTCPGAVLPSPGKSFSSYPT